MAATPYPSAHERILAAAYELFSRRSIRDVGVDELILRSGVANATFYRHFASKNDLVLAFLNRRERLWTYGAIVSEAKTRGSSAEEHLLAIFDIFDEWFHREDYEGDPFVNILIEMGPNHLLGKASLDHLATVREQIRELAISAKLRDPVEFSHSWQILMKGAIITAFMGESEAARRTKTMAVWLIENHRPWQSGVEMAQSGDGTQQ
ncbi:MAG: helix-turn-helix domain-containing protein [Microbacteriaceae bacterium]